MAAQRQFYYNSQIRRYLLQFMAIFAGLQVRVGWTDDKEPRLIPIPIANASKDRVVAAIKAENTQVKPVRLPMFSVQIVNVDQDPERRKGVGATRRNTFMPAGGLFPDDIAVVEQRMPVPYIMEVELGIWASNQDQHYQIIEQIGSIFDPDLQIQSNDEILDWTRLTNVELRRIQFNENVPSETDRRIIQTFMTFDVRFWLNVPANIHRRYIKEIFARIGAVGNISSNSFDIIADLDEQGIQYESIFNVEDVLVDDGIELETGFLVNLEDNTGILDTE